MEILVFITEPEAMLSVDENAGRILKLLPDLHSDEIPALFRHRASVPFISLNRILLAHVHVAAGQRQVPPGFDLGDRAALEYV